MRVADAIEQAKLAQQYLALRAPLKGGWIGFLEDLEQELMVIADPNRSYPSDVLLSGTRAALRSAFRDLVVMQRNPTLPDAHLPPPRTTRSDRTQPTDNPTVKSLRDYLATFTEGVDALLTKLSEVLGDEPNVRMRELAREALNIVQQQRVRILTVEAIVQSWLAFDVPNLLEPDSHLLALRFPAGTLTISQCSAWLDFLDATIQISLVAAGSAAESFLLERFESGSVWTTFQNVPAPVWKAFLEGLHRVIRKRTMETNDVLTAAWAFAELEELERGRMIAREDAEALREKLRRVHDLVSSTQGEQTTVVIEADGRVIGRLGSQKPDALRQNSLNPELDRAATSVSRKGHDSQEGLTLDESRRTGG